MKYKNNYTYPAIITYNGDGYDITFPHFKNMCTCTFNDDFNAAIEAAQDFLALTIKDYLDTNKELPSEEFDSNMVNCVYINIYAPYHFEKIIDLPVKKTLNIPAYLDVEASINNIDLEELLIEAIKKQLDMK